MKQSIRCVGAACIVSFVLASGGTFAQATMQQGRAAGEQALRDMNKQQSAGVSACSLITRADVKKATGSDPMADPDSSGSNWVCNVGTAELKLYRSWDGWEQLLRTYKKDKEPRVPAPAFGDRAHFLVWKTEPRRTDPVLYLAAQSGGHVLVLSLDVPDGKSPEAMKPVLEVLMRTALARLPR